MQVRKGKIIFGEKDMFSVESCLNGVILAYLKKLHTKLTESDAYGVPSYYCEKQCEAQGFDPDDWYELVCEEQIDLTAAHSLRMKDLEELIWTFDANEPKIEEYPFSYEFTDDGFVLVETVEGSRAKYHEDVRIYSERKAAGYKLFGEVYDTLGL